jgi:hypothetical protein
MVVAVILWSEFKIDRFSKNPGWLSPRLSREASRIKSGKQDLSFIVSHLRKYVLMPCAAFLGELGNGGRGPHRPAENISSTKLPSGVGKQK